jgi:hypothetical protein
MLVTNQHLDKLAASRIDFKSRGMLNSTCLSETLQALCEFVCHHCLYCLLNIYCILVHLRLNNEPEANEPNENTITLSPDHNIAVQGDNEEGEIVDGPTLVQAHVQLAKTHRKPVYI